jgi:hypothetical protein
MSKQLYEEALADVRKVKEIAEANAQRVILDAVTPRIREFIENELLREHDDFSEPGAPEPEGDLMTDLSVAPSPDSSVAAAISAPDEEGKITLDLDALCGAIPGTPVEPPMMGDSLPVGDEFELNAESVDVLAPILNASKIKSTDDLEHGMYRVSETVEKFKGAGQKNRKSNDYCDKIAQMISHVDYMYGYVQEVVTDPAKKSLYEMKLETLFKDLNKLQEQTMSKQMKKQMNEEDLNLKLTNLPDDIDLDTIGVDLITGEEGEEGEEGAEDAMGGDMDLGGDDSGEASGDDDGGGELDFGGDDDEDDMGEALNLSDDTIVEIDEGMLRREIARMKKLREEAAPSADGHGVDSAVMDDFGGGSDDGDPLDADMPDKSDAPAALPLGEADEDLDEMDQIDELDEMDLGQVGDRRTRDDFGGSATSVPSMDKATPAMRHESLKRRVAFEQRLQNRAKARVSSIKEEMTRARAKKNVAKISLLKKEYAQIAKRFNESLDRANKLSKTLAESAANLRSAQVRNTGAGRSAESEAVKSLRSKLAETNLTNAKLMFTNKLLQNDTLSSRQKAQVIEQLDSAKTVREAKLVYDSLAKTLAGTSKPVNESKDRKVLGSGSRATRSASAQSLDEGLETDRWARLAGIVK